MKVEGPEKPPSTARLEAFSDGVIAVIITIMVLELKVPKENGAAALHLLVPILLIYLLSFAFTGIYWINHQHLLKRIEEADAGVTYANLGFLFCLSLLPFATSYVIEKNVDSFAVALYAVLLLACGSSFLLLRLAIHGQLKRAGELRREDVVAQSEAPGESGVICDGDSARVCACVVRDGFDCGSDGGVDCAESGSEEGGARKRGSFARPVTNPELFPVLCSR